MSSRQNTDFPHINPLIQERLYEYIGGTLRAKQGHLIEIGGMRDHVHILAQLSPTLAVADVIRDVKANSSKWMNEQIEVITLVRVANRLWSVHRQLFALESVQDYIRNQEEHHRKKTFQEEYIEFLKRHNIPFQMEYLFEGEHHG